MTRTLIGNNTGNNIRIKMITLVVIALMVLAECTSRGTPPRPPSGTGTHGGWIDLMVK